MVKIKWSTLLVKLLKNGNNFKNCVSKENRLTKKTDNKSPFRDIRRILLYSSATTYIVFLLPGICSNRKVSYIYLWCCVFLCTKAEYCNSGRLLIQTRNSSVCYSKQVTRKYLWIKFTKLSATILDVIKADRLKSFISQRDIWVLEFFVCTYLDCSVRTGNVNLWLRHFSNATWILEYTDNNPPMLLILHNILLSQSQRVKCYRNSVKRK